MKQFLSQFLNRIGKRTIVAGILAVGFAGVQGCVVREAYYPPPYYYRTRLVYTPDGPMYVRERVYAPVYAPAYPPPPPEYYPPRPATPSTRPSAAIDTQAVAELHPLVAPIALYPDPLVAVLLPASTFPQQLQDASAWLADHPQPSDSAIDAQPWEPSVKAIVHYPSVLAQLTRDMAWTQSLGSAFTREPANVSAAIQDMRAQAAAEGNLVNTPQQQIIRDGGVIAIEPANPELIYVPEYDPVLVYDGYHPLVYTSVGYPIGPWCSYGIAWGGGFVFVGDWHGGYYFRGGHWGRDYGWRGDRFRHWEHSARYGPAPSRDRSHYEMSHDVRGRENDIHRSMSRRGR